MGWSRVCMALEQQSDLQPAAAQRFDISPGYPSQLENEHVSEGWNRIRGPQNQRWNAGQAFTPPSSTPTPPRTHYDPQTSAPSTLSISDPSVPVTYNDFNFDIFTNFGLPDIPPQVSETSNIALMMTLDSDSRHSSGHPEDRQNTRDSGSDKNDSGRLEETRNTRDLNACVHCHQQHIRVSGHLVSNNIY